MTEQNNISKKDFLHRFSNILGEITVANEDLKALKEDCTDKFGKETTADLIKLAKLLEKDKLHSSLEESSRLKELGEEFGVV